MRDPPSPERYNGTIPTKDGQTADRVLGFIRKQSVTVVTSYIYLMEDIPDDDVVSYSKTLRIVPVARRKRKFQRSPEIG